MAVIKHNGVPILNGTGISLESISTNLNIPISELTIHSQTDAEKAAERSAAKLTGVEFNGVMVSATSEDQHGLNAIWTQHSLATMGGETVSPVNFSFENGTKVVLSEENIDAFKAVWLPFRLSFFPMPEAL